MLKDLQINPSRTVVTSFNPKTTTASQQQQQQQKQSQNQQGGCLSADNNNDDMNNNFFEEGDWVLCVTSAEQWICCALSNGEIQVYDKTKLLQTNCFTTTATNELVTDLCRDYYNPNILAATATDGTITIFDIRQQQQQQQPVCQMNCPRQDEEALSVSIGYDGTIAAVGTSKAKIHFFDVRNTRSLVGSYSQTHTKEISRVRFQTIPSSVSTTTATTPILLSGAEDGLACLFDTSKSSEEEALANIFSVQSPVREVGFFGMQSEGVYALTGSESLLLYHKDDSVCRKNYGPELRTYLSQQVIGNNNSSSRSSLPHLEYLVDCHWDASRQELLLLAGSVKGDAGMFRLNINTQDVGMPSLVHYLHGGHRGVIRAWHPLSSSNSSMFVTVGEDARMCEWNRFERQIHSAAGGGGRSPPPVVIVAKPRQQQQQRSTTTPSAVHRPGGGKLRRPRSRFSGAASPY